MWRITTELKVVIRFYIKHKVNVFGEKLGLSEEKLPAHIQEQLMRFQQLQQTLQAVVAQKQQLELELTDTERALSELEKTSDSSPVYKSIGSLMLRSDRQTLLNEMRERRELLNTRLTVLGKQEERTRERLKETQEKLQGRLTKTASEEQAQ